MDPCRSNTLDELLQMPLNEDVFERILGMLAQEQCKKMHKTPGISEPTNLSLP